MQAQPHWKLLYDRNCPFCQRFAEAVERFDTTNQIELVSLQEYSRTHDHPSRQELLSELHILGADGEMLKGGDAVRKIVNLVPQTKPLRWMINSGWGKRASRVAYRTISYFGHCRKCNS